MLDRLASRAAFWCALALISLTGGLLSLDGVAHAASAPAAVGAPGITARPLHAGLSSMVDAAPVLSFVTLLLALAGWSLLRRETARRGDEDGTVREQMRRLHDAMQASADGVFLLRAVRDGSGAVEDFEITDVNPAGERLVRLPREQLFGKRLQRDLPDGFAARLHEQYADAIARQVPLAEDVRVDSRHFAASWLLHQVVPTADGVAVTVRDISERKREEVRLRRASLTDHLTQLYNRRGFLTLAEQQLRIARRQDKHVLLLYVDMDEFKQLNDRFGHAEGDRALTSVGRLLRRAVRDCDVVGRMGGDEFTIMALDADSAAARLIQRRIEERVALLNASGELAAPLSLTIGFTRVRPTDEATLSELLGRADQLLYARKRRRRLTLAVEARSATRRSAAQVSSLRPTSLLAPGTLTPPDLAAMARAAAVAGMTSTPGAPSFSPTHAA